MSFLFFNISLALGSRIRSLIYREATTNVMSIQSHLLQYEAKAKIIDGNTMVIRTFAYRVTKIHYPELGYKKPHFLVIDKENPFSDLAAV